MFFECVRSFVDRLGRCGRTEPGRQKDCFSAFGGLRKYVQAVEAAVDTLSRNNLELVLFPQKRFSS